MPALFEDWLRNPISIINNIFESDPFNFDSKIQEYFENKLRDEKNYFSIPCINEVSIHDLTPNCLVRFRCMIQDSFDPVYYSSVQRLKNKLTGEISFINLKYKETFDIPNDFEAFGDVVKEDLMKVYGKSIEQDFKADELNKDFSNLQQRMTFYCVPIPGETNWVKENFKLKNPNLSANSTNEPIIACLVKSYDKFDDYKINDMIEFVGILSKDASLAYMHDEHRDILESENDEKMTEIKSNAENKMETDDQDGSKKVLSQYPPLLVPRLHCIMSYNLMTNNPLLERHFIHQNDSETMELEDKSKNPNDYWSMEYNLFLKNLLKQSNTSIPVDDSNLFESAQIYLNKLRNEILNVFQELLLGDALAAEYLLMHLLSSVFLRKDVTVLGKFTLNITNIPLNVESKNETDKKSNESSKNYADCFFNALKNLIPMGQVFKLSVDNLNKLNLIPNKDYEKEKLIAGVLQLPEHFEFVIDETVLNSGELKQKGLMNLNSIKEIINWQKLNYDFGFHQQEFNTNMKVLVLSETKSILPFDVQLKLEHNLTHFDSDKYELVIGHLFDESKSLLLNNIRKYFSILSRLDYKLNQPMQQLVENDIVQIRQTPLDDSNEKMSIEDFHLLLVVARFQALSYGKNELGLAEWNRAKSLEFERLKKRCKKPVN